MISFRTLVNTTLFRFVALVIFWGYTRWIDNTPAKELLYTIGWSDLGNLTISTDENLSIQSQSSLVQKLDNIERMVQATNMSCSLVQLNTTTSNTSNTQLE